MILFALTLLTTPPVICIDPGHPSEVGPGTRGKKSTEIQAAWKVGLALRTQLEQRGYRVVMTKGKPLEKVTNKLRAEIANASRATLMLRLHCDYAPGETGCGTFIATRQGTDGKFRGPSRGVLSEVGKLGPLFHAAMSAELKGFLKDRGQHPDSQSAVGSKHGALIGSIHCKMPSILVEMCVLNNAGDEAFITGKKGQAIMVKALAAGVQATIPLRGKLPQIDGDKVGKKSGDIIGGGKRGR